MGGREDHAQGSVEALGEVACALESGPETICFGFVQVRYDYDISCPAAEAIADEVDGASAGGTAEGREAERQGRGGVGRPLADQKWACSDEGGLIDEACSGASDGPFSTGRRPQANADSNGISVAHWECPRGVGRGPGGAQSDEGLGGDAEAFGVGVDGRRRGGGPPALEEPVPRWVFGGLGGVDNDTVYMVVLGGVRRAAARRERTSW